MAITKEAILNSLEGKVGAKNFADYCVGLQNAKKKDGTLRNPWMKYKTVEDLVGLFNDVADDGLVFDGKHITLQTTGVSYDYVAYKNKMLLAYPESKIDISVIYEGDKFVSANKNGEQHYEHVIKDPLAGVSKIVGAYCVIKNTRGQFMTILNKEDIQSRREVAKTDYIWKAWFKEMVMKTVIKRACSFHFEDIYKHIEERDNEQNDLEQGRQEYIVPDLDEEAKEEAIKKISGYKTLKGLQGYWIKLDKNIQALPEVIQAKNEAKILLEPAKENENNTSGTK